MPDQLQIPDPSPAAKSTRTAYEWTSILRRLLRSRYSEARRYAVLEEVANSTGGPASRSCDLLTVNLWPSDGLEWQGHEIKASRSDWLREIKTPDKADAFARYCDRWWIVAADKSMVHLDELREGWGLMVPHGDGLRVVVGAAKREPADTPRRLFAALLRRAMEASPGERERHELQQQLAGADDRVFHARRGTAAVQARLDAHLKNLAEFEAASGLRIDGYGGRNLGTDVARLKDLDSLVQRSAQQVAVFARVARIARDLADSADQAHETAKELAAADR